MLNVVAIMGRLTDTPRLSESRSGIAYCTFSIAVERDYGTKNDERITDFFDVIAWRNTAQFVCKHFKKGQPILIHGHLAYSNYTDQQGVRRKRVQLVADNVYFCGFLKDKGESDTSSAQAPTEANTVGTASAANSGMQTLSSHEPQTVADFVDMGEIDEEDLPF